MSYPQTVPPTIVPVPTSGINKRDPLANMPIAYANEMLNFDPEPQFVKVRKGYVVHSVVESSTTDILGLGVFENQGGEKVLYAIGRGPLHTSDTIIWDVTNPTEVDSANMGADPAAVRAPFSFDGGKRLMFTNVSIGSEDLMFNGTVWGFSGFTYSGTLSFVRCATSYKGRVYLGGYSVTTEGVFYSAINAVTGATSLWNTAGLFKLSDRVCWMGVLSSPTGVASESYLCVGSLSGEVLVYSGDYPAAANWQLAATFKTDIPVGEQPVIEINNDLWITTMTGVVSIRKMFTEGTDILENITLSGAINPYWTSLMRKSLEALGVGNYYGYYPAICSQAYWVEQNKVYFLVGGFLDSDETYTSPETAATMFVYNLISQAWTWHKITTIRAGSALAPSARFVTYFNNGIYFATKHIVVRVSPTAYKDEDMASVGSYTSYTYDLQSAYTNLGSVNKNKRVSGVEVLMKTDFSGSNIGVKVASDFGRKVSAITNQPLQSGYNSVPYQAGVDGTYLQYRISGTSDSASTTGLEIYSVGINIK